MWLKRTLLAAPLLLVAALLQSYLWVPTYDARSAANPARAAKYIEASIGDAKLLNPIVSADTASSRVANLVFEGLLELGPDLSLAPKLAKRWRLTEHAYLIVDDSAVLPDATPVSAETLRRRLGEAAADGRLPGLLSVQVQPAHRLMTTLSRPGEEPLAVVVDVPPRLRLELEGVDQDLLARLEPYIGADYAAGFSALAQLSAPDATVLLTETEARTLLPVLEHNPIIEFELRRDVMFHDGHRFDADDVRFTYEAIMNPRNLSPRTSGFEPIKQLEVLDPHTVRVTYKRLFSPAIEAWTMGIIPEHLLNETRLEEEMRVLGLNAEQREVFGIRDSRFNRHPVGTGPYRFVEWRGDEYIKLTRFDKHWEGRPALRDYFYRVIPDTLTQEMEFRTGGIDRYSPEPHQVERLRASPHYQAFSYPGFNFSYIGYNNRRELFADTRVRRALGMAINTEEIIRYVLYGEAERTSGPYPTNTQWYDHGVPPLPYDPQAAARLLEEAGWRRNADGWLEKDGKLFEFNLITNNGNLVRKAVMTIAQDSWRQIGVKCNTQLFEWAVFLEDFINPGEFDAVILGWSMSVDPDLYSIWHSSQSGFGQLNFVGYSSAAVDDLIVRIRREYDPAKQRVLTHGLHREIAADQPYTFLYARLATHVYDAKLSMLDTRGQPGPLRPPESGDPFYYFTRWTRAELSPEG